MIVRGLTLTLGLARMLASRHDDGEAPLRVRQVGPDVAIFRADGSELSELEERHVRGVLAADRVEKIR